ncbi:hypothetical protein sos41_40540 [Alphaproteobacteria bacterium SO-S41]|nr:hypothetical protein sos41_40540 [Alphaproteobacteria bacterium SO-S41]
MAPTDGVSLESKAAGRKTPARPKARSYHKGNVAEDLKVAAARLLKQNRVEDISARRLAREVGVASANFYNHFPSLDYLWLDIAADGFQNREASNRRILEAAASQEEAMIEIAQSSVEFALENPELFKIMFGQIANRESHKRYIERSRASFNVLIEAVVGAPHKPGRRQAEAYAFFSFINGLTRIVVQGMVSDMTRTKAERRDFVEEVTRSFLRGHGRRPSAA